MATIMVVDDDDGVRLLVTDILEQQKHVVVQATNGVMALDMLKTSAVDMVITDLVMPSKNGIDLIMELRELKPDMPIVAMSGGGGITGRFDYLPIAQLLGAGSIINKPFTMEQLRERVNTALGTVKKDKKKA